MSGTSIEQQTAAFRFPLHFVVNDVVNDAAKIVRHYLRHSAYCSLSLTLFYVPNDKRVIESFTTRGTPAGYARWP